jgi:hypothetical protein
VVLVVSLSKRPFFTSIANKYLISLDFFVNKDYNKLGKFYNVMLGRVNPYGQK